MYMNKKIVIASAILAALAVLVIGGFFVVKKYKKPSDGWGSQVFDSATNPVGEKLPETNPFDANTNPFQDQPNPLDKTYKNPFK